jgi:hypothetical protein
MSSCQLKGMHPADFCKTQEGLGLYSSTATAKIFEHPTNPSMVSLQCSHTTRNGQNFDTNTSIDKSSLNGCFIHPMSVQSSLQPEYDPYDGTGVSNTNSINYGDNNASSSQGYSVVKRNTGGVRGIPGIADTEEPYANKTLTDHDTRHYIRDRKVDALLLRQMKSYNGPLDKSGKPCMLAWNQSLYDTECRSNFVGTTISHVR